MTTLKIAAIQMNSGDDVAANLRAASVSLSGAATDGVGLAVLPENFAFMGADESGRTRIAETEGTGPIQGFLADMASRTGMWIVAGTIPLRSDERSRPYASCLIFDDVGQRVGRYDKIHLFDIGIPGSDERYCESANTKPGTAPLVIDTPWGGMGCAVCYDLRFPEMFRYLGEEGMDFLVLPAAFTFATGQAHWNSLLRSRAIENLCYLAAAAQTGSHPGGRRTYGHSMIVDPWGEIVAGESRALDDEMTGLISADFDMDRLEDIRRQFPALSHRRFGISRPD
jgi:predicted amidohydrolase